MEGKEITTVQLTQPLPLDPEDPIFTYLPEENLPPKEAYYYLIPERNQQRVSQKKSLDRKIFYGWDNLSDFEKQKLKEMRDYIVAHKQLVLPPDFPERDLLKFCQANHFDMRKTSNALNHYFNWRTTNLPCKLTINVIQMLNTGCVYVYGRDRQFRPAIIIDAFVFQQQKHINPELFSVEIIQVATLFLMEYTKKNMLLPGQVEYWVDVTDFNKLSLKELPTKEVGALINVLQQNYMYVLAKAWILNCTAFQHWCYKVFELFMDVETKAKVSLHQEGNPKSIIDNFHPSQLEKKFGGQGNPPPRYFPPYVPSGEFGHDESNQMSQETYEAILKQNPDLIRYPKMDQQKPKEDEKQSFSDDENNYSIGNEDLNTSHLGNYNSRSLIGIRQMNRGQNTREEEEKLKEIEVSQVEIKIEEEKFTSRFNDNSIHSSPTKSKLIENQDEEGDDEGQKAAGGPLENLYFAQNSSQEKDKEHGQQQMIKLESPPSIHSDEQKTKKADIKKDKQPANKSCCYIF